MKKIVIPDCTKCPYFITEIVFPDHCDKDERARPLHRKVKDYCKIPKWCPLPNEK